MSGLPQVVKACDEPSDVKGRLGLKRIIMLSSTATRLVFFVICGALSTRVTAQTLTGKPITLTRIEPGLENAVKWKWRVVPSDEKDWGLEAPTPTPSPTATPTPTPEIRPALYEVRRGDALILIAKRFGMTVAQLKTFNGLQTDLIRVGQTLKIPTLAELSAITLSATPTPAKKQKRAKSAEPAAGSEIAPRPDRLTLQVFLDREQ